MIAARSARLAAMALLVPAALAAQGTDSSRVARPDTSRPQRLDPVVVSGTRLSPVAPSLPAHVDALDAAAAAGEPAGLASSLSRLPGVSVWNDQGTRAQPTVDVRGFTLSPVAGTPQGVSVFLDGVRVNEPDADELNFDLLPMDAVAQAALVRGPSALYGKNSLAGALTLVTARGGPTPRAEAELESGAYGYRALHGSAGGTWDGVDGFAAGRVSGEDGWRRDARARTAQLFATVGRRGEDADLALSALVAQDRIAEPGSLPESWARVDPRANYTAGDFFHPDLVHLALRGRRSRGPTELRGNVFARRNATEQYNVNVGDPSTRAFVTNASAGGTLEAERTGRLLGRGLTLTLGAEGSVRDVRYRVLEEVTPDAPQVDDACAPTSGECVAARVRGGDAAAYAQVSVQAAASWNVRIAARADAVRIPFRDLRTPSNDGTSTYRRVSPTIGTSWTPRADVRLYAATGSGFRAPAALELACASPEAPCPLPFSLGADPPLAPVVARDIQAGAEWSGPGRASLRLSAFRTAVRDEIVFVASGTAAGYFTNVPRTERRGGELQAEVPIAGGLRAEGSVAIVDARYRSAVRLASALPSDSVRPGDHFALEPRTRGTIALVGTRLGARSVVEARLGARLVSSQFLRGDEANRTAPLPAYGVVDARLQIGWPSVTLAAGVENLLDRRYDVFGVYGSNPRGPLGGPAPDEAVVERFVTPAMPRSMTVSLRIAR